MDDLQFFQGLDNYKNSTLKFINDYLGGDITNLNIYVNPKISVVTIDLLIRQDITKINK